MECFSALFYLMITEANAVQIFQITLENVIWKRRIARSVLLLTSFCFQLILFNCNKMLTKTFNFGMNSLRNFFIKVRELTEGITEMGYALFANKKLLLDYRLNYYQLLQTMKQNHQYNLATQQLGLEQQKSSLGSSQALELAGFYEDLSKADSSERESIQAKIESTKQVHVSELDAIAQEIYKIAVEEQGVEMEIKRLDTQVTATQKDLEAVEEAEGDAINRATPKYKGL